MGTMLAGNFGYDTSTLQKRNIKKPSSGEDKNIKVHRQ
jgi:hypothetical protein